MSNQSLYRFLFILALPLFLSTESQAQQEEETRPVSTDTITPMPSFAERSRKWGPNDTIYVDAVWYNREMLSYKEEEMVWVSNLSPQKLEKYKQEWTRLRNAVYVTYPYARVAGATINDINAQSASLSKKDRKQYIKSREKELRKQFTEPLSNLSVYQGKVLMKLINRQTGNNCYNLIKEYKGGFTARVYQTVAFFFGSNLKQPYDPKGDDRVIESIVMEVERMYHG